MGLKHCNALITVITKRFADMMRSLILVHRAMHEQKNIVSLDYN